MFKIRRTRQAGNSQGRVKQRGTMMFIGIVLVGALFPKLAELDGVDGFIIVHWPLVEPGTAKEKSQANDHQEDDGAKSEHGKRRPARCSILHPPFSLDRGSVLTAPGGRKPRFRCIR